MKALEITIIAASLAAAACGASRPVPANIQVPPDVLRGAPYTAGGEQPRARYVVRMTDGERDWEFQLPEIATAYEAKVPLQGRPRSKTAVDLATLTAADREILQERAHQRAGEAGDPKRGAGRASPEDEDDDLELADPKAPQVKVTGTGRGAQPPAKGAAQTATGKGGAPAVKSSYLLTLAKVKDLYRTRNYELALIELVELERQYPDDERILSMKGSLYERMGNKALARQAWQQVLNLNPYNLAVLEALQRLGK